MKSKYFNKRATFFCMLFFGMFQSAFALLPIETLDEANGAKAFLIQTKTLPMVDIEVSIDAGAQYDPTGKAGLASMTAQLLSYGINLEKGVLGEEQIADEIAELGATIGTFAGGERTVLRIRSLSRKDLRDRAVHLAAMMLASPTFDAKILHREKQRISTALLEAETKPESVLDKNFRKVVYKNYPLSQSPTVKSINGVENSDLKSFHKQFYRGDRIIVSIVGNVDRSEANEIVRVLTQRLSNSGPAVPKLPKFQISPIEPLDLRETKIPFDTQQTHIAMGMTAITRSNPDYFPLLVGNYVLGGGGFVSRLMLEVREKRGLAYSVFSYFTPGKDSGIFQAGLQTRNDQAALALQVLQETIGKFIAEGPTNDELIAAKANLVNGYPLRLDSNRKLLDNLSAISWNGLPLDTMEVWTKNVEAVSLDQVRSAFKRHLDMNRMQIVVVGALK